MLRCSMCHSIFKYPKLRWAPCRLRQRFSNWPPGIPIQSIKCVSEGAKTWTGQGFPRTGLRNGLHYGLCSLIPALASLCVNFSAAVSSHGLLVRAYPVTSWHPTWGFPLPSVLCFPDEAPLTGTWYWRNVCGRRRRCFLGQEKGVVLLFLSLRKINPIAVLLQ